MLGVKALKSSEGHQSRSGLRLTREQGTEQSKNVFCGVGEQLSNPRCWHLSVLYCYI